MQKIIFHSDDYGMSIGSSKYILDCCENGVLSSVAVMSNSPCLSECSRILIPYIHQGRINISIHLNLVEGQALCPPTSLPLLTNPDGYFRYSFEKLFLLSLSPKRAQLKEEIKKELTCQIQKIQDTFPDVPFALDSHQHFHMIPLVFSTLLEIIEEQSLSVRYIRMSCEPLAPFLQTPSIYKAIRPINVVKNLLLNVLSWWDAPRLKKAGIPTNVFWGLIFSGDMNLSVVQKLLPKFIKIAEKKQLPLEVLSHPCPIDDLSACLDPKKKGFVDFYFSNGRQREATMLKSIEL